MRKCFTPLAVMFAIALIAYPAQGQIETYTWNNQGVGTDWGTFANWDLDNGDFPRAEDTAIIAVASGYPTSSNNRTVEVLTINSGAELTVTGFNLTTDVLTIEGNADLTVVSKILTVQGNKEIGDSHLFRAAVGPKTGDCPRFPRFPRFPLRGHVLAPPSTWPRRSPLKPSTVLDAWPWHPAGVPLFCEQCLSPARHPARPPYC